MTKDIFNRSTEFSRAYKGEETKFTFAGFGTGMLVQDFNINYGQDLQRIYELGSQPRMYYVVGRPAGDFSCGKIVGPSNNTSFFQKYGDPCAAASNNAMLETAGGWCTQSTEGNSAAEGLVLAVGNIVMTRIGTTINARDMVIAQQVAGVFSTLSFQGQG